MQLTLESLREKSGFSGGLVKRQVEWEHEGETVKADVYIRPMSYHTAVADIASLRDGVDVVAQRIATCVCHSDGSPVFRVSDITGVNPDGTPVMVKRGNKMEEQGALSKSLADSLILLVGEVSGLGKTPKKNLRGKKSSGTS